ncbi:hypothetical protein [Campylobacter sp. RM16188]|uniref:putative barnase/colicin E5 family endoribonuclease n=1 Tax=Campylobacter sp. RM16188 TaxID=1705725 RepID=UPI001554191D|nr:hypothetical protein [Campylobacter sp. RM16188]
MPTIREYLGDEKIAKLESMGFLPSVVTELAKTQYYKEKQAKRNELSDAGLSGDLVQKVMRGEIDEKTAFGAQKFQDIGQKTHGLALGGAHMLTGIANAAERVSDFINPFYEGERDEKEEYVYKNAIEKTFRDKAKKAEEYRDDWEKATGKTAWGSHLAEGAYEIVADPVNLIGGYGLLTKGGKLAQFAKKSLYFSATGAASAGVSSLGEGARDKELYKNMAIGAGAGFVLGHAVDQAIIGIQKLLAKHGAKSNENVASDEAFIKKAENSDFLDVLNPSDSSGGGGQSGTNKKTIYDVPSLDEFSTKVINDEMKNDTIEAKQQVLKEVASGNESSKIISQEKYQNILNDIKEYGEQYEVIKFQNENPDMANLFEQDLKNSSNNIQKAKENSINRYNEVQKAAIKYKQENQNLTPKMLKGLINANYKPTPEEIYITRAINNGMDVENRVSGYNILYALERDIASQNPYLTPEMYFSKIKNTGYNDEVAMVFSEAYSKKNVDIAEDFVANKVAEYGYKNAVKNLAKHMKGKAITNENSGAESSGEAGRVRDSLFDLGDNASRAEAGQAGDAQISQNGGSDIAVGSENFGRAKIDEAVEERGAVKFDDADNAGISSEQVVPKQADDDKKAIAKAYSDIDNLSKEYDVERFLNDRADILASEAKHSKTRVNNAEIRHFNRGNGYEREFVPATYDKNYKADFRITKQDVERIRSGKATQEIINKLKDDLDASEYLGYNYKTTDENLRNAYKTENINWNEKPKGMRDDEYVNNLISNGKAPILFSNPDIGGGLVSGTLNSVDEDGNFSPERFVAGFLAGIAGSKAAVIALKKIAPKLYDSLANTAKAFSSKSTKEIRSEIEKINGIVPIKKFGENYAEFYHNGKGAVQKLLAEKEGQVAGAFFRKEIGDITLPWGEVGTGRSDGWGLAKIEKFHPEVLDKLEELIKTLPIKKETDGRFQLEDKIYKVGIRKEFDGYKQNWVLTAFEKDSAFASRTDFGKTPIKANVKTATSSDIVRSSGGLKPIEHSSDKGIISKKIKNGEDIDFSDKKVVNEIQKSVDSFVKDSLKDINVKDEILREFDLKNVKTFAKGKSIYLNEAQIKTLKKDISNSQIKSINENKFYFDKVGKDGDKKRFFLDIDKNGAVKIDGFNKADTDEIPVQKSAMDELIDKDKLKGMSFEEKAAYHNELDPIKKEKIVKTAELNRLKREMRGIYNVINNGKESANVYKDLQKIDDAIKLEAGSNKKGGGVHIQKHLDPASKGAVTQQEVMNIGNNVREYLKKYKEPFIDKDGGKIYEWQDKDGVRFRVAIYDKTKKSVGAGSTTRITTTDAYESIITFYSDRNLNRQMEFLDPRVSVEAKFEEFKAKNLDEDGNIKDGLELC